MKTNEKTSAVSTTVKQPKKRFFNRYYENISVNLGLLQVVLFLSLFFFIVISFVCNTKLLTYQNFYYFLKDLNASAETVDVRNADEVSYPSDDEQSFTLFRKGLAVAGENNVTVFTATGKQTVLKTVNFKNPVAVGSDKYLLVYDQGGTSFSLYNSYTEVFSGVTERAISNAAISDSGMFLLVSSSKEYTSVVSLYSKNFSLINVYKKNGYVMDASINEKGTAVALCTTSVNNGSFTTSLMLCEPGKGVAKAESVIADTPAYRCEYMSGGVLAVLCEKKVIFVNKSGAVSNQYNFDGETVQKADLSEDGVSLVLKSLQEPEKKSLIVFDKTGKVLYNDLSLNLSPTQLVRNGNHLFMVTDEKVVRINLLKSTADEIAADTSKKAVLAIDGEEILLCGKERALYRRFR